MKTIGFIDYFIDEWHANNYPQMIRQSSVGEDFEVTRAWEELTPKGKTPLVKWCREHHVQPAASIEEVIQECDCIVVLAPDHVEKHEELADLPLRSGKPVYIDKPFAPSLEVAKRLVAKAATHNTPLMSASALRFDPTLENALRDTIKGLPTHFAGIRGAGVFDSYAIHQLEMLVMLLGTGARRVMQCGNEQSKLMLIDYPDNRRGMISLIPGHPFQVSAQYGKDQTLVIDTMQDYFPRFITAMLDFFDSGISPIPITQTLEIAALIEAGSRALRLADTWVHVPEG